MKTISRLRTLTIGLLLTILLCHRVQGGLIQNPSFEAGLANWTGTDSAGYHVVDALDPVHSGSYMAYINAYPGYGTISQTVPTQAGQNYQIDFWLSSNGGQGNLYAQFGGTTLFSESNPSMGNLTYTLFSYLAMATSTSSTFTFGGTGLTATYFIDDVSITAVPEPETYATWFGVGLLVVGWLRKSKVMRLESNWRSMS